MVQVELQKLKTLHIGGGRFFHAGETYTMSEKEYEALKPHHDYLKAMSTEADADKTSSNDLKDPDESGTGKASPRGTKK